MILFDAQDSRFRRTLAPLQVDAPHLEAWIVAKDPRASGRWDELGREEHIRAFTAARTAGADVVDDLYFGLVDVIAQRGTGEDFAKLVTPILRKKGWLEGDEGQIARRVSLIYNTNLNLARAAGLWDQFWSTRAAFPYLRGITARDERVRHPPRSPHSDHRAWDGIVLPIEHPFWRRWWPPLGFLCRCGVSAMSRGQLARRKLGITSEEELARREQRLGVPFFTSPAQPIETQMAALVAPSNARAMPGRAPTSAQAAAIEGERAWQAIRRDQEEREARDREAADLARLQPRRTELDTILEGARAAREARERAQAGPGQPATPVMILPPVDLPALDAAARSSVLTSGRRAKVEFLVAFDEVTGREVARLRGTRSQVGFNQALAQAAADPARRITIHHNHPSSSSLSLPDIQTLNANLGISRAFAHAHNGSSFVASRGTRAFSENTVRSVAEQLRVGLQTEINAGRMTIDDANLLHQHVVWLILDRLGMIVYSAELAGATLNAWQRHATLIQRLIGALIV